MRAATLLLVLAGATASAEVVDRVAVAVDMGVVTESAIRRHLSMDAFLRQTEPDLSAAARRQGAERLVNQLLIRREMALIRYPDPVADDVIARIAQIRESRREDDAAFRADLAKYGFTETDLRDEVQWQVSLLRFIDFRFRPAIQVGDAEVAQYYQDEFTRQAKVKQVDPIPTLSEARGSILQLLTERKVDEALDQWLILVKQQAKLKYHAEAFE
jgi:parvulin-like peptidyl-prolyl isomerase